MTIKYFYNPINNTAMVREYKDLLFYFIGLVLLVLIS